MMNRARKESGAVMIEQALVIPVVFLILTAIFDFGLAINRITTFTHAFAKHARQTAMDLSSGTEPVQSCAEISQRVTNYLKADPLLSFLSINEDFSVQSSVLNSATPMFPGGPVPPTELKFEASLKMSCFLCGMPGFKKYSISTALSSVIHHPAYRNVQCR